MNTNNTVRDKAIEWWNQIGADRNIELMAEHFGDDCEIVSNEQIEHMYLSEHQQSKDTVPVQVEGWTKGQWNYRIYDTDIFNEIEIGVDGIRTCVIPYLDAPAEANAQRIVTAVNNFDDMYAALKEFVNFDLRESDFAFADKDDINAIMGIITKAKAILNRIDNK